MKRFLYKNQKKTYVLRFFVSAKSPNATLLTAKMGMVMVATPSFEEVRAFQTQLSLASLQTNNIFVMFKCFNAKTQKQFDANMTVIHKCEMFDMNGNSATRRRERDPYTYSRSALQEHKTQKFL